MIKDKKHILLLTAAFPGPSEPSRAVSVANAARLLARHFKVTVLTPRVYPADPQHQKLPSYNVVRFPYHTAGKILKHYTHVPFLRLVSYFLSGLAAALRIARRERVRLIYANWVLPAGLIGAVAAALLKIPLVVHAHGSDINVYARGNLLFRLFARLVLDRSACVLAVGHDLLDTLRTEFGVPSWKTACVPPLTDGAVFHPGSKEKARCRLGLPPEAGVVLFVGDVTAAKGVKLFFEAAARIVQADARARFLILGDGPLRPGLLKKSRAHGSVSLPGSVPNEEVAAYMRAADLLVLPSFSEGRPVSVLEAMQSGLPVLASRVGDLPEMITEGTNGILVDAGDSHALEMQLRRLLGDPELLSRLRRGSSRTKPEAPSALPSILDNALAGLDYDCYWRRARATHFRRRARERAEAAASLLPPNANTALDAGCGRGELLEALKGCGIEAKGLDISAVAVREARRRDLEAQLVDIERSPIKGGCDVIFCLEVLEHLRQPVSVLKKLATAAGPGGHLIVSLPNERNIYHLIKNLFTPNPAHLHRFSHPGALALFASAGLVVKRRLPIPLLPPLPGLGFLRSALCRFRPAAFAISNLYLLSAPGCKVDRRKERK